MKKLLILSTLTLLSGCSFISPVIENGAEKVAETINKYCDEVDPIARETFRDTINGQLENNRSIVVNCQ